MKERILVRELHRDSNLHHKYVWLETFILLYKLLTGWAICDLRLSRIPKPRQPHHCVGRILALSNPVSVQFNFPRDGDLLAEARGRGRGRGRDAKPCAQARIQARPSHSLLACTS